MKATNVFRGLLSHRLPDTAHVAPSIFWLAGSFPEVGGRGKGREGKQTVSVQCKYVHVGGNPTSYSHHWLDITRVRGKSSNPL